MAIRMFALSTRVQRILDLGAFIVYAALWSADGFGSRGNAHYVRKRPKNGWNRLNVHRCILSACITSDNSKGLKSSNRVYWCPFVVGSSDFLTLVTHDKIDEQYIY